MNHSKPRRSSPISQDQRDRAVSVAGRAMYRTSPMCQYSRLLRGAYGEVRGNLSLSEMHTQSLICSGYGKYPEVYQGPEMRQFKYSSIYIYDNVNKTRSIAQLKL